KADASPNLDVIISHQQLNYGSFDPALSDKTRFPSFYRMVPKEEVQYVGIVHLLKHFGWNWIGFIVSDDERGESFHRTLNPKLLENNICIAWTEIVSFVTVLETNSIQQEKLFPVFTSLSRRKMNVTLVYGDNQSLQGLGIVLLSFELHYKSPVERIWISTAECDVNAIASDSNFLLKSFNSTLSFTLHANEVPKFKDFVETINPLKHNFPYLPQFWTTAFVCSLPMYNQYVDNAKDCTGKGKLGDLPSFKFEMKMSGLSYNIYNAAHAVAHALQAMDRFQNKLRAKRAMDRRNIQEIDPCNLYKINDFLLHGMCPCCVAVCCRRQNSS
uniref:Receptor ligand binding region domain-containing protein n=1 Tax=Salvator merianae TaxID=96440 RepID=A0A8D0BXW8_SALMN